MAKQYTREELKPKSEQEINIAVAEKLGFEIYRKTDDTVWLSEYDLVDYCNNPNDIIPIQFKHGIALEPQSYDAAFNPTHWSAYLGVNSYKNVVNKNPLRAICEVFLMMEIDDES